MLYLSIDGCVAIQWRYRDAITVQTLLKEIRQTLNEARPDGFPDRGFRYDSETGLLNIHFEQTASDEMALHLEELLNWLSQFMKPECCVIRSEARWEWTFQLQCKTQRAHCIEPSMNEDFLPSGAGSTQKVVQ